ncbi:MAG TPA: zinc ribbon domain-containing protein [Nevskiaceae bacterium]|nr:zinc ribbon domain-containing protein [Nevskiaceae bacterium]
MTKSVADAASRHATGADGPYWNALAEGRLMLPRCRGCGRWHWPAVYRCGACGTWEPEWLDVEMTGRVFSWTRTWHPFGGSEGIGVPYVSLIVELPQAGGRRVIGLLAGDEAGLAVGTPVRGEAAETVVGDTRIPSLRWRIVS